MYFTIDIFFQVDQILRIMSKRFVIFLFILDLTFDAKCYITSFFSSPKSVDFGYQIVLLPLHLRES